ncbi:uncharacterized protein LOC126589734 isoform X2 [Malus sylvestris]|uniref:uncharacterized protein LOC126589734 isoform X2 n=1 Tax=Malus sylvestris TaxID=3752 RepID=UPI0021ABFCEF|nr:uncharacterized protein LOC126589734 isoform X2 [Malus sylvestris]
MGFNAVFGCLKEVFPQVDFRILRAIAIEHPFDADAAVLDVLTQQKEKGKLLMHQQVIKESGVPEPGPAAGDDHTSGSSHGNPTLVKQVDSLQNGPVQSDADTSTGSEAVISDVKGMNFDVQVGQQQSASGMTSLSMPEKDAVNGTLVDVLPKWKSFYFPVNCDYESVLHETRDKVESFAVDSSFPEHAPNAPQCDIPPEFSSGPLLADDEVESFAVDSSFPEHAPNAPQCDIPPEHAPNAPQSDIPPEFSSGPLLADDEVESLAVDSSFPEHAPNAPQCDIRPEFSSGPLLADDNLQASGPLDHTSEKDCSPREMVDNDIEETATNSVCNIDVLEEIIEDSKHNKKTLFSAMESVISMMREVEVQEKAVDIVQEEASRGGLDIMVKVEELKQMLAHAKDANDMHAGEVFGEKAILATEARELQSRLLNLSDERDKSLAILNEMRGTLEERLDAAAEARRLAEQDKLEKEECARKALAEQEAEMEKVVQESKILQQQAEENSKLREFLMDRGRIVDMLQGEISVICHDVRLLKEKFDERVPLSESVSSSQTSCILASSGSSMKSVAFDLVPERLELPKSPEKASPAPSVDGLSPKSILERERTKADQKELIDGGWDVVFDEELDV